MSSLVPSSIVLDKGLNLQTAKLIAPAGSVLDGINYEQVDFQGQKRIDGYARYDGNLLPALDEYYVMTVASLTGTPAVGDLASIGTSVFGIIVNVNGTTLSIALIDYAALLGTGVAVNFTSYTAEGVQTLYTGFIVSIVSGTDSASDADQHYANLLSYTSALRSGVEKVPGGIIGLHWFRDRLYAVADVTTMILEGTTPVIFPADVLVTGTSEATVLDSFVGTNSRIVFLDTLDTAPWYTEGNAVTRNAVAMGVIGGDTIEVPADLVASFFESRTERQVVAEDGPAGPFDFGWRFIHQGWQVGFDDGSSLFGSLPSLNQNIEGIGIQGPTSTTGNNGRPLILLQRINITNAQAQVNGWKSTQTPTSFLLDPDNLTSVDSDYIYADAFFSWDGTTGQISQPGITTSTLPEYSATATVEVDV